MRQLVLIAIIALAPAAARSQSPEAATPAATRPPAADWTFGGGLSTVLISSTSVTIVPSGTTTTPVLSASLERRVSDRSWLAIGADGWVARHHADVAAGSSGVDRDDSHGFLLTAGIRQVVTGRNAPVDVSLLYLVEGGAARSEFRAVFGSVPATVNDQKASIWSLGAELGVAVDRELTGGLSLRVASPLVRVSGGRSRTEVPGQPTLKGTDFSAVALLAPRLELRLAF